MSILHRAREAGRLDALLRYKAAFMPMHPVVRDSAVLRSSPAQPERDLIEPNVMQQLQAPTSPDVVKRVFDVQEQGKTHSEPTRKLADDLCTTCRKEKHYGPCLKPPRTKNPGTPLKEAGFNAGLSGSDPQYVSTGEDAPSVSPHYHSATTADSSLARARDGRPADEQAATGFADLFRHLGIVPLADQAVNNTNGLNKTAWQPVLGTALHSLFERRGPTVNIYEEGRPPGKARPVGWGDEGEQRVERAFDQIDNLADSTNIDGSRGDPQGGPAVLG